MFDEFINPKSNIQMTQKNKFIKTIDKDDSLYESILKDKPIIDDNFVDNFIIFQKFETI